MAEIQLVRLIAPMVLEGHYPPEAKNVEATEKMTIKREEQIIKFSWINDRKELCQAFTPFSNVVQVIFKPEPIEDKRPVGRPPSKDKIG